MLQNMVYIEKDVQQKIRILEYIIQYSLAYIILTTYVKRPATMVNIDETPHMP